MIHIVDFGSGNLAAISGMLRRCGVDSVVTSREGEIRTASKLILPGVGAFEPAMLELGRRGLKEALTYAVISKKVPVLGICLGAQLMFDGSEEGNASGLGWLRGRVVRFQAEKMMGQTKIPHMGWCDVIERHPSTLLHQMDLNPRFYFAHSYHFECFSASDILLEAHYGYTFAAAVGRENILGVQFHPEKSHRFGMKLLSNFALRF